MEIEKHYPLSGKNILMLLDGFFPGDLRVDKEVSSLTQAGASVTVVCYRKADQPETELGNTAIVYRTKKVVDTNAQGLNDILTATFGNNRLLLKVLRHITFRIDAVHVHDIPSWQTASHFARLKGVPLILDMHENYPEGVITWFSWRRKPLVRLKNKLFFSYNLWLNREKIAVMHSDRIITVVEEMRDRIALLHSVDQSKITVVRNSEPRNLFSGDGSFGQAQSSPNTELVYVGGIGPHRGLDTALKAMPLIISSHPDTKLVVVGSGNRDTMRFLNQLTDQLGVRSCVEFTGQQSSVIARQRMRGALLNIIPHHSNGQNESGLPHKLFQIFLSRYPLLVSSCKPLQRIVGDNKAGLVFKAGDPADFAEKVIWAVGHKEELKMFAERAYQLAMVDGYNWETDGARLVEMYTELFK